MDDTGERIVQPVRKRNWGCPTFTRGGFDKIRSLSLIPDDQ